LYITKLLERLKIDRSNPLKLLILASTILKPRADNDIILKDEVIVYKQIVSFTIYFTNNTRPDISYNIRQLARFIANPGAIHLIFAKQLLQYFNGTRTIGIIYSIKIATSPRYYIYSDAIWGIEDNKVSFHSYAII
jgi:hypothetical protein